MNAAKETSYVARGVSFMCGTPWLWKMIICPFILMLLGSVVILIVLFAAVYAPQSNALEEAGVPAGWAWFLSFFLVLIYTAVLVAITFAIIFGTLQQRIFDRVYAAKASEAAKASMDKIEEVCCAECRGCGWFIIFKLLLNILTIPLNMVPILGQMAYAWINGLFYAWDLHRDYFAAHGVFSYKEQYEITHKHAFYSTFGTSALMLETVPIVGTLFMFSNAAGAALFAAEQEPVLKYLETHPRKGKEAQAEGRAGSSQQQRAPPNQQQEAAKNMAQV